jgi:hypothetical protein
LDGGAALTERRHAQAAGDAAALAAAGDLYTNYRTNNGQDLNGSAAAAAQASVTANYAGYPVSPTVDIRVSPQTPSQSSPTIVDGQGRLKPGYVEVSVQYAQSRYLSSAIPGQGNAAFPISGRAVARGQWVPATQAVLALNPTGSGLQGQGLLNVSGGPIVDNSNSNPKTPDPLAYLPAPVQPPVAPAPTITFPNSGQYTRIITLSPGTYTSSGPIALQFGSRDLVVLQQASAGNGGVYYFQSNGFQSNGADIQMDTNTTGGVMFYNFDRANRDAINIVGGNVSISPLTNGIYQGISIFQARNAPENMAFSGDGGLNISGTIYAPDATLKITTNNGNPTVGSQLIANAITVTGNGAVNVNYNADSVARTRLYGLVE